MDTKRFAQKGLPCTGSQRIFALVVRAFLGAIEIIAADIPAYRSRRKGCWYRIENIHEPRCFEWVHESDLLYRGLEWDEQIATPDVPANK